MRPPKPDPGENGVPDDDPDLPHDVPAEPTPDAPPTVTPDDSADETPDVTPEVPSESSCPGLACRCRINPPLVIIATIMSR